MIDQALACLATTIFMEARGEGIAGQIAVGYVLYRRADFKPENICIEMKKPYQFSWYGKLKPPSPQALKNTSYYRIAYEILHLKARDYSKGATNFHSIALNNQWGMKPRVIINNHVFY
jgi:spore germination cell wall hydrolase CwlJ-like protein